MKKYKFVEHSENFAYSTLDKTILVDIICDICQKTCKSENTHEDYEEGDEIKEYDFQFLEIKGSFGYHSKKHDTEAWEAQICEDCSENYLEKIVCFTKFDYLSSLSPNDKSYVNKTKTKKEKLNKDYNDFLNERANRIRKVRKLTGDVEFKIVPKKEED